MPYCPLNIFTGFTFLSSTLKVEDIYRLCDQRNYPYFGICDLNSMYAYGDAEKYRSSFRSVPLYGATFIYLWEDEHPVEISCFIATETGYRNLIRILSLYPHGITEKDLSEYKSGLISILPTISNSDFETFIQKNEPDFYQRLLKFGKGFDRFYLGIEIYTKQDAVRAENIRSFARKYRFESVAFNRHLYLEKNDAIGLTILKAIQKDERIAKKEEEGPYYFLNSAGLETLYSKKELENTFEIAEFCKSFIFLKKRGKLLSVPISDKKELLLSKCSSELKKRNIDTAIYRDRLHYELDIIDKMGFSDYFLIVEDYVRYAKDQNIPVGPGRGSSAGSLVSYLLGITEIDSVRYNLFFERFLNPERTSMPDIDIDFADYRRDDISKYIQKKYGFERTGNIITFQTFGARAAIRDIGRVFSIHPRDISSLTSAIGKASSLKDAYRKNIEFRELCDDSYYLEIVRLAKKIEGLPRQSGMHAAGIIVNDENLLNSLPIVIREDGSILTQFEAPLLEKLGFLKMDLLGLTTLTMIESMQNYIRESYLPDFDMKTIPLNDEKTFSVLNQGLTSGIFQLESSGITRALREVQIRSFDDLVAVLALYRPGPMENIPIYASNKNRQKKLNYIHSSLESVLKPTYGVIIYQEQIMQIVQIIAGFDLGKADLFRRAISKKDSEKLQSLKIAFIEGAKNNKIPLSIAEEIFRLIQKFADYGFNKSHSVSYAVLSYQMAYAKANFPAAYYCSMLNHLPLSDPRIQTMRQELVRFSLHLHLPSIRMSKNLFVIEGNHLILPFSMIRGINRQIVDDLISIQNEDPKNFMEFMEHAERKHISESAIVSLINAGCFDEYGSNRQTLRAALPIYRQFFQTISMEGDLTREELKQFLPIVPELEENEHLKYELEYQALGLLLSGSLLEEYQSIIRSKGIQTLKEQTLSNRRSPTAIAVIVNRIKRIKTKRKEAMAILSVQDDTMEMDVILFPKTYEKYNAVLSEKIAYIIEGVFREDRDSIAFIAEKLLKMEDEK